jgi:hypothetical protein
MNRIARSAIVAVAVAWPAIACTSANAQNFPWKGMSNPNLIIDNIEPRPPIDPKDKDYAQDMATYQRLVKIYERVKKRQVLEELSAFLSPLRLPKKLRVRTLQCNTVNAFCDPNEFTLKICYEWMDATEQMAPAKLSPEGFTRQEVIVGGFVGVLLHEMGHAISDVLDLPVLGREEDAADQIAVFIMLQFGKEVARTAIKGTAFVWLTFSREGQAVHWDTRPRRSASTISSASATAATPTLSRTWSTSGSAKRGSRAAPTNTSRSATRSARRCCRTSTRS